MNSRDANQAGDRSSEPITSTIRPSAQSLQIARTLWRNAAGPNVTPTVSIKAGGVAAGGIQMKLQLPTRTLRGVEMVKSAAEFSDFDLVRVIGKEGMGVVYSARQLSLDREIALKLMPAAEAKNPEAASKFLAEAVVTGLLDHPNVVPVYDVGRGPDGSLFYAMKEVRGTCWADVIKQKSLEENLQILLAVCDAVAFAHDHGIIHRDLKPENVMLGSYGEVIVMDWGLAASVGNAKTEALTSDCSLAGTPAYVAPEMAVCDFANIGRASDIYLLGGCLYEILTGNKPHPAEGLFECIAEAVENIIPPLPRKGELEDIAMRALATLPRDRYASVKEFQQAIRDYLSHSESLELSRTATERLTRLAGVAEDELYREATEIIVAFQQALKLWPGNREAAFGLRRARETFAMIALRRRDLLLAKSQVAAMEKEHAEFPVESDDLIPVQALAMRISAAMAAARVRERLIKVSIAVAAVAGVVGLAAALVAYWLTREERDKAIQAREVALAERNRAMAAESSAVALRRQAEEALAQAAHENYFNAVALAYRRLGEGALSEARELLWNTRPEFRGWEWGWLMFLCHRDMVALGGHSEPVFATAFSPDMKRLVSAGFDNTLIIWDLLSSERTAAIPTGSAAIFGAAFSGDGRLITAGTRDGKIRAWDLKTLREQPPVILKGFSANASAMALSPDGRVAAAADAAGRIRFWDCDTGTEWTLSPFSAQGEIKALGIAPAGRQAAALAADGSVSVWNPRVPGELLRIAVSTLEEIPSSWISLTPDGRRWWSAGPGNAVVAREVQSGRPVLTLHGHSEPVLAATVSPDGRLLATAGADTTVRIWDANCWGELTAIRAHTSAVVSVGFTTNAERTVSVGEDHVARVWDGTTGKLLLTIRAPGENVTAGAVTPDGKRVFLATDAGLLRAWNTRTGQELAAFQIGKAGMVSVLAISSDGSRLAWTDRRTIHIIDAFTGVGLKTLANNTPVPVHSLAFSPDGEKLAVGGSQVWLYDTRSGLKTADFLGHTGPVTCLAFSPDGALLLAGDRTGAKLWRVAAGQQQAVLARNAAVTAVSFTPNGRRAITGGQRMMKIWDVSSARELLTIPAHSQWITAMSFCSDGRRMATGDETGVMRLWLAFDVNVTPENIPAQKNAVYSRVFTRH